VNFSSPALARLLLSLCPLHPLRSLQTLRLLCPLRPQGELKRKLDRMMRRFLTKHGGGGADEMMSFSVACTVVRIQRHWRELVARRKEEAAREAARSARRAAGLPSEEEPPPPPEEPPAPEPNGIRGVMRRASVAIASIRHSMNNKRGSRAAAVAGGEGWEGEGGSPGLLARPPQPAAAGHPSIAPRCSSIALGERLSRISFAKVAGAARHSIAAFAQPRKSLAPKQPAEPAGPAEGSANK
jgi:hypothetical protein